MKNKVNPYEHLPIKLTYGVIVIDLNAMDSDGKCDVLYFVGFDTKPTETEMSDIKEEFLKDNPEYGDSIDNKIVVELADEDVLQIYKDEYLSWFAKQN